VVGSFIARFYRAKRTARQALLAIAGKPRHSNGMDRKSSLDARFLGIGVAAARAR